MADPASAGARNTGNPDDEEERPDVDAIDSLLASTTGGDWSLDARASVVTGGRFDLFWLAPDMEGHADAAANLELAADAKRLLRLCTAEIRRLRSLAGIVE